MTARQVPDIPARRSLVAIFMGVSGVGKTTVGQAVAEHFGWPLFDGDHFHSPSNIDKMRRGIALNDNDRAEWLEALRARIRQSLDEKRPAIVTCSALKKKYRDILRSDNDGTIFIYLQAERGPCCGKNRRPPRSLFWRKSPRQPVFGARRTRGCVPDQCRRAS